jgi:5-formyltetrahydrofolate cyclo-ligase
MRQRLRCVPAGRFVAAGRVLYEALAVRPEWQGLGCLLGFAATAREPATAPVLAAALAAKVVVGLPRAVGMQLRFHQVDDLSGLRSGYRGVAEPPAAAPALEFDRLPPAMLALVPGAAFDRAGGRLGWGGGHYDRALAELRRRCPTALLVGVCMPEQVVPRVPRAAHDVAVDLVLDGTGSDPVGYRHDREAGGGNQANRVAGSTPP